MPSYRILINSLILIGILTACDSHPGLGDRKAALDYLTTHLNGPQDKPTVHSLLYFTAWCAEGENDYWPKAVTFCNQYKEKASGGNLCSFVNIAEAARTRGKNNCDPT